MNCSNDTIKRMTRKQRNDLIMKRIFISWAVVFILGLVVGALVMFFYFPAYAYSDKEETKAEKNFNQEVQQVEPFPEEWLITDEPTVAPTITPTEAVEPTTEPQPEKVLIGRYKITAYCSCRICCGSWADKRPGGIVYGASGKELKTNHSCASPLPFGTVVEIDGLGTYTVEDRTADWVAKENDNKIIDIYFDNHEEASKFGCKYLDVYEIK